MSDQPELAVRRAESADAEVIGRLLHDFNREFGEPTPEPDRLPERIRRLIAEEEITVLVGGTGPDGLAVLRFRPAIWTEALECYLAELYVVPGRRGRGLGRALMEAAIEFARRAGADQMDLGTGEDDVAARALYESLGFSNRGGKPAGPVNYFYERELVGPPSGNGLEDEPLASATHVTGESENVRIVRRLYEALNRGGWEAVLAELSPEIELETDPRHPKAGIYRGLEQYRAFVDELEEPYDRTIMEPEQFFAKGDQVVAFVRTRRRPKGSTAELENHIAFLWTLREGKIVREQVFGEREKALEAAGMRQSDLAT